ncbi:hypothetical protein ACFUTU_00560 [Arthrobacter sp. NPDC057388]|uniref:hypothetical protein n=1 Tax=Arthrobacter sp. NPDC057388 TaxID=3346116 RepID=UPI00362F492E
MTSVTQPLLTPGMIEVNVSEASDVDQALENAVASVMDAADRHRTGVMITRTGPGRYIVRAHPTVPHGLIRQQED